MPIALKTGVRNSVDIYDMLDNRIFAKEFKSDEECKDFFTTYLSVKEKSPMWAPLAFISSMFFATKPHPLATRLNRPDLSEVKVEFQREIVKRGKRDNQVIRTNQVWIRGEQILNLRRGESRMLFTGRDISYLRGLTDRKWYEDKTTKGGIEKGLLGTVRMITNQT